MPRWHKGKKMNTILRYVLFLVCMLTATSVLACRCNPPELSDAYKSASLVVHASVNDVVTMPSGEGSTAILEIKKAWKAVSPARIAAISLTNCNFPWEKAQEYILFLTQESNGIYSTDRCTGSIPINGQSDTVNWLEKNATPQSIKLDIR
jgi:hypothetical protein